MTSLMIAILDIIIYQKRLNQLLLLLTIVEFNRNKMGGQDSETYRFIYEGVEYDITDFVPKHPGGT